jgi:spore maturation protein SpmB
MYSEKAMHQWHIPGEAMVVALCCKASASTAVRLVGHPFFDNFYACCDVA